MRTLLRTALFCVCLRVCTAAASDYLPVGVLLDQFIQREMRDKGINGVAVALVDNQRIIWSHGYGVAKPDKIESGEDAPPTGPAMEASRPFRAGSVSKLFTSILIMREVEAGRLDLDAPITKYLPEFRPTNHFSEPITLRHILAHRSGIVREPPYGNYFETNQASLSKMVESLNDTEIVYAPGERTKYSNAAIATAGYIAAESAGKSFRSLARKNIFSPLDMRDSSFRVKDADHLAEGLMWTLHGTKFRAPIFEFGMSPAASLTTTVLDLGKFASALIADANGANKLLRKETLEKMWQPQFVSPNEKRGFGVGFSMSELDGHRKAGHNGAVYGFATDFSLLPDDKMAAIVVVTRDFGNTVASRISTLALRSMLAAREGKVISIPPETKPIPPEIVRRWKGKFATAETAVELVDFDGKLHLLRRGLPEALRYDGKDFITDGLTAYGTTLTLGQSTNVFRIGVEEYHRQPDPSSAPEPPASEFLPLIGEYGWDHDVLYIFEKEGRLWSLIEWFEFAPLEQITTDIFRFPDYGSYAGEKLVFKRGVGGKVSEVIAANVRFKRRRVGSENNLGQARIRPIKPVADLMKKAALEKPPSEKGDFKEPDLVPVASLDPTITLEIRYATTNNFLGSVFYSEPGAFLQRPAAEALARVNARLRPLGYGLRIFDAYRPWAVTKVFWDATSEAQHEFVADPSKGSRHNRGCAVDLTLYDLATGASVEMTSTYDETTDRSYPTYPGGTSRQHWHRELLRKTMEDEGFTVYYTEWWHFDYNGWRAYPILNIPFSAIK
jgi:CubicO group peptidase (beta-lactamase class C family)/D-alanyl-D-alanine dipeptidase